MIITAMTVSSKLYDQFCSVTVELDEQDDARPEAVVLTSLDLKLRTSIACVVNAMADYTLTPDRGREKISELRARVAALKEKIGKP